MCRHTNLVLSDVIDEDTVRNSRLDSESTLIHGVAAFFSKPGQSLAPVIAMLVLDDASHHADTDRRKLFYLMVGVPLAVTSVQFFLWRLYSLRDDYLAKTRQKLMQRPMLR